MPALNIQQNINFLPEKTHGRSLKKSSSAESSFSKLLGSFISSSDKKSLSKSSVSKAEINSEDSLKTVRDKKEISSSEIRDNDKVKNEKNTKKAKNEKKSEKTSSKISENDSTLPVEEEKGNENAENKAEIINAKLAIDAYAPLNSVQNPAEVNEESEDILLSQQELSFLTEKISDENKSEIKTEIDDIASLLKDENFVENEKLKISELLESQKNAAENPEEFIAGLENQNKENAENEFLAFYSNADQNEILTENGEEKKFWQIQDFRTKKSEENISFQKNPEADIKSPEIKNADLSSADVTLTFTQGDQQNLLLEKSSLSSTSSSSFQNMLKNQILSNTPEIVKTGQMILRDNNSGTINMILKPENLGNVKLSLQVSDKVITGQILVHSEEAYRAFNETLENLKNAFVQNGFDSANISLSLSQGGLANQSSSGNEKQYQENFFMAEGALKSYAEGESLGDFERGGDAVLTGSSDRINMIA